MASTVKKAAAVERALEIIAPDPQRRAECEHDLAEALRCVKRQIEMVSGRA